MVDTAHVVGTFWRCAELDAAGRIATVTDFWPAPYEPPADRAHLTERT